MLSGAHLMTTPEESMLPAGERSLSRRFLLCAFTLFASYCLAGNLALAWHEFGHSLGIWLAGGKVLGFVLAPQGYSAAYAARDFRSNSPRIMAASSRLRVAQLSGRRLAWRFSSPPNSSTGVPSVGS